MDTTPRTTGLLTITRARNQEGWTGRDDLLRHDAMEALVGTRYRTVADLRRAADEAATTWPLVEFRDERGRSYRWDGSPEMPGRDVVRYQRIA